MDNEKITFNVKPGIGKQHSVTVSGATDIVYYSYQVPSISSVSFAPEAVLTGDWVTITGANFVPTGT